VVIHFRVCAGAEIDPVVGAPEVAVVVGSIGYPTMISEDARPVLNYVKLVVVRERTSSAHPVDLVASIALLSRHSQH